MFLTTCTNAIKRFFSGYFNQLMISLILLFIFRPYNRGIAYMAVWQGLFTIVFLSSTFNCNHPKKVRIAALLFGIPALIFNWLSLFLHHEMFVIIFLVCTLAFILICATSILYRVLFLARVTLETLRGVICAYFMVAFAFAFAYFLIELLMPGTFNLLHADTSFYTYNFYLSEMMYFSFVTLLCIGYGDITAIRDIGQTFTILEGIFGQFYIAILVARLVSVYSIYANQNISTTKTPPPQIKKPPIQPPEQT